MKWLHKIWTFLQAIIIFYVVCVILLLFCRNQYGYIQIANYTLANVTNSSLTNIENVKNGDLLIIKNSSEIKENDKIYYYAVSNDSYVIAAENVVSIEKEGNNKIYTIHKDNQNIIVSEQRVLGKTLYVYGEVGKIISTLESRKGFLLFILFPIIIIFIYQIFEFIKDLKNGKDEEPKKNETLENISKKNETLENISKKNENDYNNDDIEIL